MFQKQVYSASLVEKGKSHRKTILNIHVALDYVHNLCGSEIISFCKRYRNSILAYHRTISYLKISNEAIYNHTSCLRKTVMSVKETEKDNNDRQ